MSDERKEAREDVPPPATPHLPLQTGRGYVGSRGNYTGRPSAGIPARGVHLGYLIDGRELLHRTVMLPSSRVLRPGPPADRRNAINEVPRSVSSQRRPLDLPASLGTMVLLPVMTLRGAPPRRLSRP